MRFQNQHRQTAREYVSGESHHYKEKRYIFEIIEKYGRYGVTLRNNSRMVLEIHPGTTVANKEKVIQEWY